MEIFAGCSSETDHLDAIQPALVIHEAAGGWGEGSRQQLQRTRVKSGCRVPSHRTHLREAGGKAASPCRAQNSGHMGGQPHAAAKCHSPTQKVSNSGNTNQGYPPIHTGKCHCQHTKVSVVLNWFKCDFGVKILAIYYYLYYTGA